jgi:uncharacterized protein YyaL (SSP411 family)
MALKLTYDEIKYFEDTKNGGFFLYGNDSEKLITKPKEIYDGATPSGNSVTIYNLIRLSRLTRNKSLEEMAIKHLQTFSKRIISMPFGHSFSLCNILFLRFPPKEVIISGNAANKEFSDMLKILNSSFQPFTISNVYSNQFKQVDETLPFLKEYKPINNKPTAYICENFSCKPPINDPSQLVEHF